MIGISTMNYDEFGAMIFPLSDTDEAVNDSAARRCTRTATLDGGCEIYDTGYSDSDRTLRVKEKDVDLTLIDFVKYIIQNYGLIVVTTRDGAYRGVPDSYNVKNGVLLFNILIESKIS